MSNEMIIRAWKDQKFRSQLASASHNVPANPAGSGSLSAKDVEQDTFMTTSPQSWCSIGPLCQCQ